MDQAIVLLLVFLCSINPVFGVQCYGCNEMEVTRIDAGGKRENKASVVIVPCSNMTKLPSCPMPGGDGDKCIQLLSTVEFQDKTVTGVKFEFKSKLRGCDNLSTAKPLYAKGGLNIESGKCSSPADYAKYTKDVYLPTFAAVMQPMVDLHSGNIQSLKVLAMSYCLCDGDFCNQNDTMPAAQGAPKPSSAVLHTVDIRLNIITTGFTVAVLLLL